MAVYALAFFALLLGVSAKEEKKWSMTGVTALMPNSTACNCPTPTPCES
jgi:hypothetical protein